MNKYFPLVIITIVEALIGIWVKLVGNSIPIFTLNFYRVFFAFIFLAITLPFLGKNFLKINKSDIKPAIIIGLLIALQISTFNIAMKLAPVANVVILWSIYPFFVFIFSKMFLHEKADLGHFFIFALGLIGIYITEPFSGGNIIGNSVSLAGGIIFASLITYIRKEDKSKPAGIIFWFFFFATLFLLPMIFIFGTGDLFLIQKTAIANFEINAPPILWILGLGVISTGIAYLFMTFSLKRINANIYSLIDLLVSPIMAGIFAFLILKESPSSNMITGGIILIISAFLLTKKISGKEGSKLRNYQKYLIEIESPTRRIKRQINSFTRFFK